MIIHFKKKLIVCFSTIAQLILYFTLSSQELGLNYLQSTQVYNGRNPSTPFPRKTVINLPDLSGNLYSQTKGYSDWITNKNFSLENFWSSLEKRAYTAGTSWSLRSFYFGKKYNRFQWGISHSFEGVSNFKFHKDLVGIFAFGNAGLLKKESAAQTELLHVAPVFNTNLYQSFGVELAIISNDHWGIGGGIKYLSGIYNITSDIRKLDIDIRDPFELKAAEDWTIKSGNFITNLSLDSSVINRKPVSPGTHSGVAFSFGIYHQQKNWRWSGQIQDVGFIQWKGTEFSRSGNTVYKGIDIPDLLTADKNIFNQITDTLKNLVSVTKKSINYTTKIRTNVVLDALYTLTEKVSIGGAALYRINNPFNYWKISGTGVYRPSQFIHMGGQLSVDSYSFINIGIYGSCKLSVVNLYGSFDHIGALLSPARANRFSGNIGMSIMW